MAETLLSIAGSKEMVKVLQQLPDRVMRRVLRSALMQSSGVIRKAAIAAAPRGPQTTKRTAKYGRLYKNIRRVTVRRGRDLITVDVGVGNAFWGRFLEHGTSRMRARRWLGPAFERSHLEALRKLGLATAAGIEKETTRLVRENRR